MAAGPTFEPIATQTLASAAASITFSSIAASWTDLRLVITGTSANSALPLIQFNGDTASNYSCTILRGDGTTASSVGITTKIYDGTGGMSSTIPSFFDINIFSYAGSTYKTLLWAKSEDQNGSGNTTKVVGLWRSTSAITSIKFDASWAGSTFAIGTTATLYGIKAA